MATSLATEGTCRPSGYLNKERPVAGCVGFAAPPAEASTTANAARRRWLPDHHPQEPPVVEGNCRLSRSQSSTPNGALKHVSWADVDRDPLRHHGTISHGDTDKFGGY